MNEGRNELTPQEKRDWGLSLWEPFRDMVRIGDTFSNLFEDFFGNRPGWSLPSIEGVWHPRVDIRESDKEITVTASIPGLNREDINVEIDDNVLTIKGERKEEKEKKEGNYLRREQVYGSIYRSFRLPPGIDTTGVKAKYKNGILELTIPKKEETKPKLNKVPIEGE